MFAQESVMEIQNEREVFEEWASKNVENFIDAVFDGKYYVMRENSRLNQKDKEFLILSLNRGWSAWQASTSQAVPEGFVLLQIKDAKFFSHDGDNYEVHDTLVEAKYEAECAIEHYRERLADQLSDPRSDGNFQDVGYGVVLAKSGYSIDHVVTQADIDKGDYSYEVGTEILSLFLVKTQGQSHE